MKRVFLATITASALAWPSVALAQPVFLTCTLTDQGGESTFDVQLNETANTVSYFIHRNGMTVKKPAIFTPEKVLFNGFEIDRKDLTFRRDNTQNAFYRVTGGPAMDVGKCVIDREERAF